jgi:hypothetical protein
VGSMSMGLRVRGSCADVALRVSRHNNMLIRHWEGTCIANLQLLSWGTSWACFGWKATYQESHYPGDRCLIVRMMRTLGYPLYSGGH